jgi:hypothetical protein
MLVSKQNPSVHAGSIKPLRLMAILEASTLTGPAKNLLQFVQDARSGRFDPTVEVSIVIFRRSASPSIFMEQARQGGLRCTRSWKLVVWTEPSSSACAGWNGNSRRT